MSQQLQKQILDFISDVDDETALVNAQSALVSAINMTNTTRSNMMMGGGMPGMGMNMGMGMPGMMGGMGMGMPNMMCGMPGMGMNPMMGGMGMNPMMGGGMPGMGMNMGMGMPGMNTFNQSQSQQSQDANGVDKKATALNYIKNMIWNADPVIYIWSLLNSGLEIDVSADKAFDSNFKTCLVYGAYYAGYNSVHALQFIYTAIYNLVASDYQQRLMQQSGGNNAQQQTNMMGMSPMMMGGMGMPGMMGGMGMPNMMGGMPGMGMNPMMGGMMPMANGMDQMMGGGMPGMGMNMGMGMPGMMGGMGMGMPNMMCGATMMPGMNNTMA